MSGPSAVDAAPATDKTALVAYLEQGCKPRSDWRIGTEHEKIGYILGSLKPLPYDGPQGIRAMLEGLTEFGWKPVCEGDNVIALTLNGQSVSLEPGGQLELSGAPLETIHQTCNEVNTHLAQVRTVAERLGVGFLGIGIQPKWLRSDIPVMPKGRYGVMLAYMPKVGNLGLDMMLRTCTVQANLDFADEADMVRKFRVSLALQPIATALFANSPFTDGRPNGFLSYRSHIWTDTDPDRTGMMPFVFETGMGFERYVDFALDVPMYFVYRDGKYINAAGQSFRDFMAGKLPALPGELPTMKDWEDHMTTAFPEVRLKTFLEMRGADGGPWARLCALSAFWVGLLYDTEARDAAWDLVKDWTDEEREAMRRDVPKTALKMPFRDRQVKDIACEALCIARQGLKNRKRLDAVGLDESHFLQPIYHICDSGMTAAEELLVAYERRWHGDIDPVFTEYAY